MVFTRNLPFTQCARAFADDQRKVGQAASGWRPDATGIWRESGIRQIADNPAGPRLGAGGSSMPTKIEKVEAHAGHLLDGFLALRERYALLHPMLFEESVAAGRGSGPQGRGFRTLRSSLFLNCAQDIAKLAADADPRTPSVFTIASALRDDNLIGILKARYSAWVVPSIEDETDPEIVEAFRLMEIGERAGRAIEFDRHLQDLHDLADQFEASPTIVSFRAIRDKVTAHTEVRFVADRYQLVDVAALGLKWKDLKEAIDKLQRAVELVGMLVRNVGFAWDALDKQLFTMANDFWTPVGASPAPAA